MYEWGGNFARIAEASLVEYFKYHAIETPAERAEAVGELWGKKQGLPFLSKETHALDDGQFVSFLFCFQELLCLHFVLTIL